MSLVTVTHHASIIIHYSPSICHHHFSITPHLAMSPVFSHALLITVTCNLSLFSRQSVIILGLSVCCKPVTCHHHFSPVIQHSSPVIVRCHNHTSLTNHLFSPPPSPINCQCNLSPVTATQTNQGLFGLSSALDLTRKVLVLMSPEIESTAGKANA